MGAFVLYMLQVSVIMTLLYLTYRYMLSSSTYFSMNRWIINGIYVATLIVPLFISILYFSKGASTDILMGGIQTDEVPGPDIVTGIASNPFLRAIIICYYVGMAVFLIYTLINLANIIRVFKAGFQESVDGVDIITSPRAASPFSWGGKIVVRPEDHDDDLMTVVRHEQTHLRLNHWIDLMVAHVVMIFQWFSPASWFLLRELKNVHEYQVDRIVSADNPRHYQMLLLQKTYRNNFPSMADAFNRHQTKKRIEMMLSDKPEPNVKFSLTILTLIMILGGLFLVTPAMADLGSEISATSLFPTKAPHSEIPGEDSMKPDEEAEYMGGNQALYEFIILNIDYNPPADEKSSRMKVKVTFSIDRKGNVYNVVIPQNSDKEFARAVAEVLKKTSGSWTPAVKDGKPVESTMTLPVTFALR